MAKPILEMKNIIKDFPGVRALDHVDFKAYPGEVLVLAGENGAGKSTLMKVLSGVWPYPTYEGDIIVRGELKRFKNTREAEKEGIAIIHQELNLIPELSVAENLFLSRQFTNKFGAIDWDKLNQEARKVLGLLNIDDIDVTQKIKKLTVGRQQMVEIAKALSLDAKVLVFDEPTSALTEKEVSELFKVIKKLKKDNVAMIYISHKMDEFKEIGDKIAVLRDGKTIGEITSIEDVTLDSIITRMVGRDISDMFPKKKAEIGKKVLEVKNFNVDHPFLAGEKMVEEVNFDVKAGEVFGISGLMGAGRTELVTGIFGAFPNDVAGEIYLNGKKLNIRRPEDAIKEGMGLITEDRKELGLFLNQSLVFNTTTTSQVLDETSNKFGVLDELEGREITENYVRELNTKTPSIDVNLKTLSGGNQQKVIIGKWLATKPKVLILDEPTRGIDVGAKTEIYRLINKLAAQGVAIIMISSELPEIMGMSDTIAVMCEGKMVAQMDREEATKEKVIAYATGNFGKENN
ncbi:MAG: sugar ABC transporter ATP-binding protein [Fusobacteriota bacterium]